MVILCIYKMCNKHHLAHLGPITLQNYMAVLRYPMVLLVTQLNVKLSNG